MAWLRLCAKELELDGVELLDLHFPSTERDYLRTVKQACTGLGLTISCASVSNDFGARRADDRQREVAKVKDWIEIAAYLGAPVLRVFAGWVPIQAYARKEGVLAKVREAIGGRADPKRELWPSTIDHLRACAELAEERGVVLGIENHNGRGIVGTADEVERCLRDVGSPWLRLNLDTGDYGDLDSIRRTLPDAVHVHGKLYDLDEQGADRKQDWPAIAQILREGTYRGFVSIEYEGREDAMAAVPRGVQYLRGLLREMAG
jgi:sugar phosphate isomerase/epimerase